MRKVISELNAESSEELRSSEVPPDRGFRVFKLAASNFMPWQADASMNLMHVESTEQTAALTRQLELHIDHIRKGRSAEDILTELLLKSGFPLGTQVQRRSLCGKDVFSVTDGAMLVCLEKNLTPLIFFAQLRLANQNV